MVALAFLGGAVGVLIACPIAWFILSHWLFDRSLIIASVAAATALNLGRFAYSGPVNIDAFRAIGGLAGSIVGGIFIARLWLTRWQRGVSE